MKDVVYWLAAIVVYLGVYLAYRKVVYPKLIKKWLGSNRFFELLSKDLFVFLAGVLLLAVLYFLREAYSQR